MSRLEVRLSAGHVQGWSGPKYFTAEGAETAKGNQTSPNPNQMTVQNLRAPLLSLRRGSGGRPGATGACQGQDHDYLRQGDEGGQGWAADALAKAYRNSQRNWVSGASWPRRVPVNSGPKEQSVASS